LKQKNKWGLGIGDWGLGIGDWGLGPIPNPQSPIPNFNNIKYIMILNIDINYIKYKCELNLFIYFLYFN